MRGQNRTITAASADRAGLFGIILATIALTIYCTTAALFPYPYYGAGLAFLYPFLCALAVQVVSVIFIFRAPAIRSVFAD